LPTEWHGPDLTGHQGNASISANAPQGRPFADVDRDKLITGRRRQSRPAICVIREGNLAHAMSASTARTRRSDDRHADRVIRQDKDGKTRAT